MGEEKMIDVDLLKALNRALVNREKIPKREIEKYSLALWAGIFALRQLYGGGEEGDRVKNGPPRFGRQLDP